MDVEITLVRNANHDKLVDVLRSMNHLLNHVAGAVPGLDDLGRSPFALPIIQVYHRAVLRAGACDDFLDPPADPVKLGRLDGHDGVSAELSAVPAPASLALAMIGFASLSGRRRRQQRRTA